MSDNPNQIAAFFDLDRTLILENSASLYIKYERKHGRVSLGQMFQAGAYLLLYHFSLANIESAFRKATTTLKGKHPDELQAHTQRWFEEEIADLLLPGAEAALEYHQEAGHPRVLLTGSTEFMAREVMKRWPLDDWLANRFLRDEGGVLTGEVSTPLCYDAGKVHWAEQWAEEHQINLDESYFYTDSSSDLPMLERVRHPRVVNPDPRLRRTAIKRGWPVLDWTQTSDAVVVEEGA